MYAVSYGVWEEHILYKVVCMRFVAQGWRHVIGRTAYSVMGHKETGLRDSVIGYGV